MSNTKAPQYYTPRKKCPYSELFWSAFFLHFPASVSLRVQSVCGKMREKCLVRMQKNARKMRTRITPNTDTFYAVIAINNQNMTRQFLFREITKSEINQKIWNLGSSKVGHESGLPTKIIKANSNIFTEVRHKVHNKGIKNIKIY